MISIPSLLIFCLELQILGLAKIITNKKIIKTFKESIVQNKKLKRGNTFFKSSIKEIEIQFFLFFNSK